DDKAHLNLNYWFLLIYSFITLKLLGYTEKTGCAHLPLSSRQKELCKKKPDLLPSIKDAARLGVAACHAQFRHERWNCSTDGHPSLFGMRRHPRSEKI
uniref:Protein Wnt n=1 Tax=Denticeps clupeoides TaxID=299321 RepID=A0AAY4EQ93_9TELE